MSAPFEIKIDRLRVEAEHELEIFEVELTGNNGGAWVEAFSTEAEVKAFIKGAAAASDALGQGIQRLSEIPDKPSDSFVRKSTIPYEHE